MLYDNPLTSQLCTIQLIDSIIGISVLFKLHKPISILQDNLSDSSK